MSDGTVEYKFGVEMSCGGCSGAVERVLKRLQDTKPDDVISYNVDLEKKTAKVVVAKDTLSKGEVKQAIEKSGKAVTELEDE